MVLVKALLAITPYTCSYMHSHTQTQMLAEKQTSVYTLQRKLKLCRQSLDSKELHLGLVQKKVTVLEEKLLSCVQKEKDREASIDKVCKP